MKKILVIAPHPDDETLGCGGSLLRHLAAGDEVHWLIVTDISTDLGFTAERVSVRSREIDGVTRAYGFQSARRLGFPSMRLDQVPTFELANSISQAIREVEPDTLYLPYRNDVHSDHADVFDAAVACTKVFRYPSIRSVLAYETLSETEFGLKPEDPGFRPNLFINIGAYLDRKIEIMNCSRVRWATSPSHGVKLLFVPLRISVAAKPVAQLPKHSCY